MATVPMGFRAQKDTHQKIVELAEAQNRSLGNILQLMVAEQLKRVEANGFDAIFYKPGDEKYEQEAVS